MNHDNTTSGYTPLTFTAATLKGMGDRPYQEDTCLVAERSDCGMLLAMIADGMGGMQDGRLASRTAVSVVKRAFMRFDPKGDISAQLYDALRKANDALYALLHADGGTTGVACVFTPQGMLYAGVGDSFLLLRRGKLIYHLNRRQNVYYALCDMQIRRGSMDKAFAEHHPDRGALTGYLGMKELRDVDRYLRPLQLLPGDTIMLCSDGIGDVLSDEELLACLSEPTVKDVCRRLDEKIIDGRFRHQDNYSAAVIRCD